MKICETSEPKFKLFGVSVRYNVNGALFCFQPRTPHDPVTPHEELLSRSNSFLVFYRGRGPLKNFFESAEM